MANRRRTTRRIGVLDAAGYAAVIKQRIPPVRRGQVLVRVRASLISPGTELAQARQARTRGTAAAGKPKPFGYQNAGDVVAVGAGVSHFGKGDRVACIGGGYAQHTDFAVVPQNLCAPLPTSVSYEEGAYGNLAITSLQAIRRGGTALGENLLIVGLGIVGQLAGQLGGLAGMYVMGWDMLAARCRTARKCGFGATVRIGKQDEQEEAARFTGGQGFDVAIMAIGGDGGQVLQNVKQAMKLSPDGHAMGRVVMVGGLRTDCQWGAGMGNLDVLSSARTGPGYHDDDWEHGRVNYPPVFVRWNTRTNMELVLRLISEGRLKVKLLTTHRMQLEKIADAVDAHINAPGKTLGTVLLMD